MIGFSKLFKSKFKDFAQLKRQNGYNAKSKNLDVNRVPPPGPPPPVNGSDFVLHSIIILATPYTAIKELTSSYLKLNCFQQK